ncbi:NADH-quinone oxidoreductase subunit M [Thalassotalea litorea]|uniref:NADH-quinone oxidoreductase subunit M n=1 Tax=Thalassotalea litorea TaxID=2020715 RepID=A0A5R9IF83_9GAMM|nr:NADH-quinone oxidoreductase subunit M [Thalassotalea litorea]TLU64180.1 NADH-quinone oxidoreductase subunit M [Thalassotalea litorea]
MIFTNIIAVLMVSAFIALLVGKRFARTLPYIAAIGVLISFALLAHFASNHHDLFHQAMPLVSVPWISSLGIEYATFIDSLSFILVALTLILALVCILVSVSEISQYQNFYYFNLLAALAGIVGVFAAADLFLFFFFWEVMLLPMTALIAIWGHENRRYAAIKFFIFTQVSSLLMLVAIIVMAFIYQQQFGDISFNYFDWQQLNIAMPLQYWLMLGFFVAFAVKLPSFPFHTWLPDAHTQAPTAGSVLLAGVLLKTGAYGLMRFVLPLFEQAATHFAPVAIALGVISIVYGAVMAFAQTDFKRLVAYSSISHMGFITLALFSFSPIAYHGAIVTLVAHGLSSAALFAMAGMLYQRLHTRDLKKMGGLFASAPRMGGMLLAFVAGAFGMPGLLNFVGEFMTLTGTFTHHPIATAFAATAMIGSAIYGMYLFQQSFQGKPQENVKIPDLRAHEWLLCSLLFGLLLYLGLFPQALLMHFDSIYPSVADAQLIGGKL